MSAVIMFDFDGVLADSLEIFFREFTAACTELGFDKLNSRVAFLKLFEGNLVQELVKAGFPIWRLKKLVRAFEPRIAEASRQVRAFAGMPELLGELASVYPVYVISSNVTQTVLRFLETYGVSGVQDVMGGDKESSKVKKIKRVRKRHRKLEAFYVGDTKGDMVEGRAAGARTVGVTWGWHPVGLIEAGCPDYLVRSPGELRGLFLPEVWEFRGHET